MTALVIGLLGLIALCVLAILIYPLTNNGKWSKEVWPFVYAFVTRVTVVLLLAIFFGNMILYILGLR